MELLAPAAPCCSWLQSCATPAAVLQTQNRYLFLPVLCPTGSWDCFGLVPFRTPVVQAIKFAKTSTLRGAQHADQKMASRGAFVQLSERTTSLPQAPSSQAATLVSRVISEQVEAGLPEARCSQLTCATVLQVAPSQAAARVVSERAQAGFPKAGCWQLSLTTVLQVPSSQAAARLLQVLSEWAQAGIPQARCCQVCMQPVLIRRVRSLTS